MSKWWNKEEVEYLKESWGTISISRMAKKLNRTELAVHRKAERLKLGAYLDNGEYITFNQLLIALNLDSKNSAKHIPWVKNRDFPLKKKKVNNSYFNIVYIDDFWKWAEHNQDVLDFSKLDYLLLGKEPDWVNYKRKSDAIKNNIKISEWTKQEDEYLEYLLQQNKYTYPELSKILNRTEEAIKTRIFKLNIPYKPIKLDTHNKWTDEEINILLSALDTESNYIAIQTKLPNRSVKAIKSKIRLMFGTQKLNEVKLLLKTSK